MRRGRRRVVRLRGRLRRWEEVRLQEEAQADLLVGLLLSARARVRRPGGPRPRRRCLSLPPTLGNPKTRVPEDERPNAAALLPQGG